MKTLKAQIGTSSDYDREKLQEQLAKLSVAWPSFASAQPPKLNSKKKARVEDAMNPNARGRQKASSPAAVVLFARLRLGKFKLFETDQDGDVIGDEDEQIGVSIVRRALEEPASDRHNAGKEGAVIVESAGRKNPHVSYNAETETFEDLVAAGCYRSSQGHSLRTTKCGLNRRTDATTTLISELQDDDKPQAMPAAWICNSAGDWEASRFGVRPLICYSRGYPASLAGSDLPIQKMM